QREGAEVVTAGGLAASFRAGEAEAQVTPPPAPGDLVDVTFTLNGEARTLAVDSRRTALELLREGEGLAGTKVGCRHGQCGACTIHLNGAPVLGCLTLAAQLEGAEVVTIEGLAARAEAEGIATVDGLHPVQSAFVDNDAFQCGYCTPGQIMSAVAVIAEGHASSEAEVREYMSGNLCRCAAYPQITAAVMQAAAEIGATVEGGGARQDLHLGVPAPYAEDEA
ncbi:(2Fe-2S)-binding protein, partial [Jannaschia aquimarina]|uniref:(2Fe-2S)-binding protein n=1 Tax=Jannaschia aquimarina TaxID=935700 RepID=UPI000A96FC18